MTKLIHTTSGIELIRALATNGQYLFNTSEARTLASSMNLSPQYLNQSLHYLANTGWIIRLKKGSYAISNTLPGIAPLHEFAVAMALTKPAVISHWSAMSYHGFTQQIPNIIFITTTARNFPRNHQANSKSNEFIVMGHTYKFIHSIQDYFFGHSTIWLNESKAIIADREKTLLDGIMMPHYCGNFFEVIHAYKEFMDTINLDQLINYALKLNTSTIKRLGWILDEFNLAPQKKLDILQATPIKGYRLLDVSQPKKGKYNKKWMIQVNL